MSSKTKEADEIDNREIIEEKPSTLSPLPVPEKRSLLPRVLRWIVWGGPVFLWLLVLYWGGSEGGRYETSWYMIHNFLDIFCPEFTPIGVDSSKNPIVSMYQLNGAFRRVAHIGGYAVLTVLVVRLIQRGEPRLKRASLIASVVLGLLFTAFDELHRRLQPNRHAKWLDYVLNFVGVFLTILVTLLYFHWKEWERRLSEHKDTSA